MGGLSELLSLIAPEGICPVAKLYDHCSSLTSARGRGGEHRVLANNSVVIFCHLLRILPLVS